MACLNCVRSCAKSVPVTEKEWIPFLQDSMELSSEDKMMLSLCMESLGDEERKIVVLHAVGGLKNRKIAPLLKLLLSNVLSKYNRAIKKLKLYRLRFVHLIQDDGGELAVNVRSYFLGKLAYIRMLTRRNISIRPRFRQAFRNRA